MAAGLDVRLGAVVSSVAHGDGGVEVTLDDGAVVRADAAVVALPLNVWSTVAFDPPLSEPKRRAADRRHPGEVSKVLAVVHGAPATYLGMGWNTPINAGFLLRPAGDGRLFMGFSVQDRVDLADPQAVAAAVRAHLPEATVATTAGHDWVGDRFSRGTWLSVPPPWFSDGTFEALSQPEGRLDLRRLRHRARGRRLDRGRGRQRRRRGRARHLRARDRLSTRRRSQAGPSFCVCADPGCSVGIRLEKKRAASAMMPTDSSRSPGTGGSG